MNNKSVENLSNAIILSAVADYRRARKHHRVDGKEPSWVIRDCERFFLSEWFKQLTDINGEWLLNELNKE